MLLFASYRIIFRRLGNALRRSALVWSVVLHEGGMLCSVVSDRRFRDAYCQSSRLAERLRCCLLTFLARQFIWQQRVATPLVPTPIQKAKSNEDDNGNAKPVLSYLTLENMYNSNDDWIDRVYDCAITLCLSTVCWYVKQLRPQLTKLWSSLQIP